ncbi:MAG TPA: alginate export family protein, partial [Vicinamibacterales bacterium]|nr:alginate export family protein [Vicinamibacterales bacterium]
AGSVVLEAGHRWPRAAGRPWLRAGYAWASGDSTWNDGRHATFFQMLPSSRQYALSSAYTHMNLRDTYVQLLIEPRRFNARIEVHKVALASGEDLWYQGSGATSSGDRFFGFAGRFANGETSLGTVLEGTIEMPIRKHWSVNAYAGVIRGGRVVKQMFTDKPLTLWSVENVIRF